MSWVASKKGVPGRNNLSEPESFLKRTKRFAVVVLFFALAVIFCFGVLDVDLFRSSGAQKVLAQVNGRTLKATKNSLVQDIYQQYLSRYEAEPNQKITPLTQQEKDFLLQQAVEFLVDHYVCYDYAIKRGYSFDRQYVLGEFIQLTKNSMGVTQQQNSPQLDRSIIEMLSSGSLSRSQQWRRTEKYLQEISASQIFQAEYFDFYPVARSRVEFFSKLLSLQKVLDVVVFLRSDRYKDFILPQELENFQLVNKEAYKEVSASQDLKSIVYVDFVNANVKELNKRMDEFFSQAVESIQKPHTAKQIAEKFSAIAKRTQPFRVDASKLIDAKGQPIGGIQREEIQQELFFLKENSSGKFFFFKDALVWVKLVKQEQVPDKKPGATIKSIANYHKKILKEQFLNHLRERSTISYSK